MSIQDQMTTVDYELYHLKQSIQGSEGITPTLYTEVFNKLQYIEQLFSSVIGQLESHLLNIDCLISDYDEKFVALSVGISNDLSLSVLNLQNLIAEYVQGLRIESAHRNRENFDLLIALCAQIGITTQLGEIRDRLNHQWTDMTTTLLPKAVCVSKMARWMTLNKCYEFQLLLLLPNSMIVSASASLFIVNNNLQTKFAIGESGKLNDDTDRCFNEAADCYKFVIPKTNKTNFQLVEQKWVANFSNGRLEAVNKRPQLPRTGKKKPVKVGEVLHNIFVVVEMEMEQLGTKKIEYPLTIMTNSNQSVEAIGSAVWNSIVSLNQMQNAPTVLLPNLDNAIPHGYFVEKYLRGIMTVLTAPKCRQKPDDSKQTKKQTKGVSNSVSSTSSQDSIDSDENPFGSIETGMDENLDSIPTAKLFNPNSSDLINQKQLEFIANCLWQKSTIVDSTAAVTKESFLGDPKSTTNFGINPVEPHWFGNPNCSVWHSKFVIGYISEEEANQLLLAAKDMEMETISNPKLIRILLIRFSTTFKQNLVVQFTTGETEEMQVRYEQQLADIINLPTFGYFKVICYDPAGSLVLRDIEEIRNWIKVVKHGQTKKTQNQQPVATATLNTMGSAKKIGYVGQDHQTVKRVEDDMSWVKVIQMSDIETTASHELRGTLVQIQQLPYDCDIKDELSLLRQLRHILNGSPVCEVKKRVKVYLPELRQFQGLLDLWSKFSNGSANQPKVATNAYGFVGDL